MEGTQEVAISAHDRVAMSDQELLALNAFENTMAAEADPTEPPIPAELTAVRSRLRPSYRRQWTWLGWAGETVVAAVDLTFDDTGDNEHVIWADIGVAPAWRRRGLARQLLAGLVEVSQAEGRPLVMGWTDERVPAGEKLCQALGAERGLHERESILELASIDWDLVQTWVDSGPRRAPGYEVFGTSDRYPDDLVAEFAELYDITNTAPREDLQLDDEHVTPDIIREWQRTEMADGRRVRTWWARHRDSGRLVGWTEVQWHPLRPHRVEQEWTAVDPHHRGHALGKWLKARALLAIREEWPEVVKVVTQNAYSNDAMLGINDLLGFRETHGYGCWQVATADLRSWLGRG